MTKLILFYLNLRLQSNCILIRPGAKDMIPGWNGVGNMILWRRCHPTTGLKALPYQTLSLLSSPVDKGYMWSLTHIRSENSGQEPSRFPQCQSWPLLSVSCLWAEYIPSKCSFSDFWQCNSTQSFSHDHKAHLNHRFICPIWLILYFCKN